MSRMKKCVSFPLRTKPAQLPSASAFPILQHELVDEELCPADDSKCFYRPKPGEVLGNYFQVLVKIGWGTRAAVWFVREYHKACIGLLLYLSLVKIEATNRGWL